MEDKSAAEKAAKDALAKYPCQLGGGIEWYTAQPDQRADLIKDFKGAVAPKPKDVK